MTPISTDSTLFKDNLRAFINHDSSGASPIKVPRRTNIYNCGQRDGNIYLVESGQIKTQMYTRCGKQCLLSIYTAGDVFGELSLLGPERSETATAMRTSAVRRIPATRLRAGLTDGNLLEGFIDCLALRLAEQQEVIATMVTMDSEQRLASVLLRLARKIGTRHSPQLRCIEERITQEELSGMVGTTRSRVGYFLKRFRDAGLVQPTSDLFLLVHEQRMADYLDVAS
ncbi:Crp/Fnr family transcriptional regulator [Streptosporangium subroseum]|uniref:Crp/Fnr family transcriptional regulator n=1 Tax=Streptosporangium subroseum TaxID=106412 RepID=UPI0030847DF0|nr:Crp/Fnr family transcriptional regulator [Streptosporangium subroseum]